MESYREYMKAIPGFKGAYLITAEGDVTYSDTDKPIVPKLVEGYLTVNLLSPGIAGVKPTLVPVRVHTIIVKVYFTGWRADREIAFLDGNRRNCSSRNLQWLDLLSKEEIKTMNTSPIALLRGAREAALDMYLDGRSTASIAEELGVSIGFVQKHATGTAEGREYRSSKRINARESA